MGRVKGWARKNSIIFSKFPGEGIFSLEIDRKGRNWLSPRHKGTKAQR